MDILFIHRHFPGQFVHLAAHLATCPGTRLAAVGDRRDMRLMPGLAARPYDLAPAAPRQGHPYLKDVEEQVRRGQAVLGQCRQLAQTGFYPALTVAHPGWGEALYVKDVFPETRLLAYAEFYYRARNSDFDFDPEFPPDMALAPLIRTQNAAQLVSLAAADRVVSPTRFQRDAYPDMVRERIAVVHDGVDTDQVTPDPGATFDLGPDGPVLTRADEVVTMAVDSLEPCRGVHTFVRAIPAILAGGPGRRVVVAGGLGVKYGRQPRGGRSHLEHYLSEASGHPGFDPLRVHILGRLDYPRFLGLLRVSSVHVYLTYPFILSWSFVEALAAGCLVLGSDTPPVTEFLRHGENGLLTGFFDSAGLAGRVGEVFAHPDRLLALRREARRTALDRFDWRTRSLPALTRLMADMLAEPGRDSKEAAWI